MAKELRGVPLSEEEQRILGEIERQLYETDEDLAHELSSTTVYSHAFRNLKWATASFVVGVGIMLATLQAHYLFAFVGFLVMLASALFFERNARQLGRTGLEQITRSIRPLANRPASRFRRSHDGEEPDEEESEA